MVDRGIDWAVRVLDRLSANPWLLFAVAFAGNAVVMPYLGLYHDAILYAGQVIHSADGHLANDLFFKYGSQNDYTLMPRALAALSAKFGVEPVFFVAYLIANAARLGASQLLMFRLFGRNAATAAGILLIAVADVPTGCSPVFRMNEPFFTARVPAIALSILALERVLAGRYLTAGVCLVLGMAMHPLMAFPAAAIAGTWVAWEWATTPTRRLIVAVGFTLGLAVVGVYLARTVGTLDPEWLGIILGKNSYLDPLAWRAFDNIRLIVVLGCVVALTRVVDGPRRRFLWVTVAAAVGGYLVAVLAVRGSWALLLQGQAYRAVWILELLGFPAAMVLVSRLWADPSRRVPAMAILALSLAAKDLARPISGQVFAGMVAIGVILAMISGRNRSDPGWLAWALAVGLGLWSAVWYVGFVPFEFQPLWVPPISDSVDWVMKEVPIAWVYGPIPRLTVVLLGAAGLLALMPRPGVAAGIAALFGVGVSVAVFEIPRMDRFADRLRPRQRDHQFLQEELARRWHEDRPPTIYWPYLQVQLGPIWTQLRVNSYFSIMQMSGITFSRECARESRRRLELAWLFEIQEALRVYRDHSELNEEDLSTVVDSPPPSREDFLKLAADPEVDFLVLPADFGGACASNGRVWIYDCRQIRTLSR